MADERRAPLATWADRLNGVDVHSGGRLRIREIPFTSQVDVRVGAAGVPLVSDALGVGLPTEPNTFAAHGNVTVGWLGPDEWLVLSPPGTSVEMAAHLRSALDGHPASVVDVSAQRTTVVVGGPAARDMLAHGCALDLGRTLGVGRCAQTMLARAQVILWHPLDDEFRMLVRASYAGYLASWLLDAAAEHMVMNHSERVNHGRAAMRGPRAATRA